MFNSGVLRSDRHHHDDPQDDSQDDSQDDPHGGDQVGDHEGHHLGHHGAHDDHGHDHHHDHHHGHGLLGHLRELFGGHSHDAADSVDDALESSAEGIRAVRASLLVLGATGLLQALLFALTGSVALLADTIHNVADALTALPLWVAFALAGRAATRRYTYGFGRAEDLAGVFIVAMITFSGLLAGWESLRRLADPQPLADPWVVMAAGLVGFAGNEAVAGYRIRVGRRIGSAALEADGVHARTDGFTSLAVVLGGLGALAGWDWADPLVGVLITVAILAMLRGAARDIYRRLMDAVDPELVDSAEAALGATPGVLGVPALRLRWVGHRVRAEATIAVADGLSLVEADAVSRDAAAALRVALPKLAASTVQVRPHSAETPVSP